MMNSVAELPDTTTHRKTREMRTNLEREKTEGKKYTTPVYKCTIDG